METGSKVDWASDLRALALLDNCHFESLPHFLSHIWAVLFRMESRTLMAYMRSSGMAVGFLPIWSSVFPPIKHQPIYNSTRASALTSIIPIFSKTSPQYRCAATKLPKMIGRITAACTPWINENQMAVLQCRCILPLPQMTPHSMETWSRSHYQHEWSA